MEGSRSATCSPSPSSVSSATEVPERRVQAAVFLLSAAVLADEILLIRLLSIRFWPHFVSLIVSQAMLGFGASGVALSLLRERVGRNPGRTFAWLSLAAGPSVELCFLASQAVPFDPFLLLWEVSAWPAFCLFFAVLSVPFFLAGAAVAIPLAYGIGRTGPVYGSMFAGSAAGALLALPALSFLPPGLLLRLPAFLCAAAGILLSIRPRGGVYRARAAAAVSVLLLILAGPAVPVELSPYKGLYQVRRLPDATELASRRGDSGDFRAVFAPGLHHAPGLSLSFRGTIPPQAAVFQDGEIRGTVPKNGGSGAPPYLGAFPGAMPYRVVSPRKVLQSGLRGTEGVLSASLHGARSVTVAEPSRELARLVGEDLAGFSGGWPAKCRVGVVPEGERSVFSREEERFDLIEFADVSSMTFSSLGIHAAGENYLLTVEGVSAALGALSDNGALAFSGWLKSPPRESIKVLRTLREAMDAVGGGDAADRVLFVRGWGSFSILARKASLTAGDLAQADLFCRENGFRRIWPPPQDPGGGADPQERTLREETAYALRGGGVTSPRLFDLDPVRDDSPYFHRFVRLRSLPEFRRLLGEQWLPFVEWGVVFLFLSLAVSALLSLLFLLAPAVISRGGKGNGYVYVYFGALGLSYLLFELTFLKIGILLLGSTTRAASAAIGGFSFFSGIGSAVSGRFFRGPRARKVLFPALSLLAATGFLSLSLGSERLLSLGLPSRSVFFLAALAPAAFLMGMPFPAGIRALAENDPGGIPTAWGINGFFSVAGASLASLGAIWFGFRATILAGAILYLLAGVAFPRLSPKTEKATG